MLTANSIKMVGVVLETKTHQKFHLLCTLIKLNPSYQEK